MFEKRRELKFTTNEIYYSDIINWIKNNKVNFKKHFPKRLINSIYFDNYSYSSFKENIYSLISASNEKFLDNEYINLISAYKKILSDNDEDCVQIFTDEIAIPYLLSKKSCTKYYVMITAAPKSMQLAFIEELNFFKPKIILFKSRKFEFEPQVEDRLKLVNNFIKKNYQFYLTHNKWDFYRLIN